MLASGALAFGAMGALFLIDSLCFENRFGSPIGLYELAIVGPPFVIMFGGAYWADRIKKTAEKHVSSP